MLDKSVCKICEDKGHYRVDVPIGDPRFGKLIRCDCMAQEDAKRLQRLSGLLESELQTRLDDIDIIDRPGTFEMVRACRNFIAHPFGILTLWGGTGNAKTTALQAVVNHSRDTNQEAIYITSFDLISYIRAAFSEDRKVIDDNAYSRLRRFEEVRILAVDEFDKTRMTEWVLEQITDLIDRRYRLGLDEQAGTLIAMNSNPDILPMWIYSRLCDGRNQIVCNTDSDIRPYFNPNTNELLG